METLEILQHLAIVIIAAMIFAKILGFIHFPDVTGFLIGGIIIGPMVLNLVPADAVDGLAIISEVALAIIAFSIGAEMKLSALKQAGAKIIILTIVQAMGAFVLVFLTLFFIFKQSLDFCLVIASISIATAPAATLMVIRQYKAKGPLVDTLIPVVALDDAVCIIVFGVCTSIAYSIHNGMALDFMSFITPVIEIVGAVGLGAAAGILSTLVVKRIKTEGEMTAYVLAVIFLLASISLRFHLSSLLVMMSFGLMLCNMSRVGHKVATSLDGMTTPLFMCFFTLSGSDLDFTVFASVGAVAAGYIIARALGKYLGVAGGAIALNLNSHVKKYMGLILLPQAGVAIGLSLVAHRILGPALGDTIRAITLAATVIYEIVGPFLTKIALVRAGEIEPQNR